MLSLGTAPALPSLKIKFSEVCKRLLEDIKIALKKDRSKDLCSREMEKEVQRNLFVCSGRIPAVSMSSVHPPPTKVGQAPGPGCGRGARRRRRLQKSRRDGGQRRRQDHERQRGSPTLPPELRPSGNPLSAAGRARRRAAPRVSSRSRRRAAPREAGAPSP